MKTKVPFAGRTAVLAFFMMLAASASAVRLAELQIFDSGNHRPAAVDDLIDTESIPAQRGIIMDRNEELLTNNIQSAELVADRYHLREITAVVEGLAYNQAVNDPRWESLTDPRERRKLLYMKPARVAYREKIKGRVEAHGRHKKQSGGSGQFGDVWVRFEPQDEQDDLIFAEEVFGGSVPRNFFPSVEKGLRNAVQKGVLAGYPLVGLKATLYDGSYHPVDSNDMAFQTAARLAYQDGIPKAKPTIMEPIGLLKVTIPDANLGDIMADISSKRRGTVLGMNAEDGMQIVEAEVPMAEMSSYTIDLRSMTQGRGSFSCKFIRYEEAPGNVQQKVIEEAKAAEAE